MEDISDRFQIPQKLYGREEETSLLLRRFFRPRVESRVCWPFRAIPGLVSQL